jgi:hypothetical protein
MFGFTGDSPLKPVYGYPLEEHLRVTQRKVAFPIELCVCALLELGMEEEGLFRVAGGMDIFSTVLWFRRHAFCYSIFVPAHMFICEGICLSLRTI